jgi:hypothetical protein
MGGFPGATVDLQQLQPQPHPGCPIPNKGLATGLATMSQQIGITMGTPIMSAIFTAQLLALGSTSTRRFSAAWPWPST